MPQAEQAFQIKEKLASLEDALLTANPTMPTILREIHRHLKSDPEVVTLLSEEECSILIQGLKKQTSTHIATKAIKKSGTKAMSKMQVGTDL